MGLAQHLATEPAVPLLAVVRVTRERLPLLQVEGVRRRAQADDRPARLDSLQFASRVSCAVDRAAVDRTDDVADAQLRIIGRTASNDLHDQGSMDIGWHGVDVPRASDLTQRQTVLVVGLGGHRFPT